MFRGRVIRAAGALGAALCALETGAPAAAAVCLETYEHHISRHETGGCGWTGGCRARNPHSTAAGCFQMTKAALADVGWKDRAGRWLPNPYGIRSDAEFADSYPAQRAALRQFTGNNWRRIDPSVKEMIGATRHGVRITEGGLLSAAHFLGPGGLNDLAACGFRPDCVSDQAAAANGGRARTHEIAMRRLAGGGGLDVSEVTGFHTGGDGGRFAGLGAAPPAAPGSAFLPWAGREREQPPLQGGARQPARRRGFLTERIPEDRGAALDILTHPPQEGDPQRECRNLRDFKTAENSDRADSVGRGAALDILTHAPQAGKS